MFAEPKGKGKESQSNAHPKLNTEVQEHLTNQFLLTIDKTENFRKNWDIVGRLFFQFLLLVIVVKAIHLLERQQNIKLLSKLDDFDQDVIIGDAVSGGMQNFVVNNGPVDWNFTVSNDNDLSATNKNTVNVQMPHG